MAEMSRRAARSAAKGGLPNLILAVAAAEMPPPALCGRVDEVTILFPWGSLLRGTLALDADAAAGIAALIRPGGRTTALVSVTDRDVAGLDVHPADLDDGAGLTRRWRPHGLEVTELRKAGRDEILASGSTWGRRLIGNRRTADRPVWRLGLRCGAAEDGPAGSLDGPG